MPDSAPSLSRPLPWTRPAWETLWRARQLERMPHALLVCGPAGVGKRAWVAALAEALLCAAPGPDGLACGACQDCHLLAIEGHPDRLILGPDPDGKSPEIKVDGIRALLDDEALTPHRGRRKVVVIDPAHQLNRAAANSLLKTLEEPCPTTLLILVTEEPGRLPATIRSRCQRVILSIPSEAEALAWLAPQVGDQDPRLLLRLAHGAPRGALALLVDGVLADREARFAGFCGVFSGQRDPVAEARAWLDSEPGLLCEWLGSWISDLVRLAVDPGCVYLGNPDKRARLATLAAGLDSVAMHLYLRQVFRARSLVGSTINRQLLYESLLIELARLRAGRLMT